MEHARITGLFDELEKIGGVTDYLIGKGVETTLKHPGMVYWRGKQMKEGANKHRQMMQAVKHGYPAGWVALGMRPR